MSETSGDHKPLSHRSPFSIGFFGGAGALLAYFLGSQLLSISSYLILILVALFLAAGLNPAVEWFTRRGLRRPWALLAVIVTVLLVLTGFVVTLVPVITEQVALISRNAPGWLESLQHNSLVQDIDDRYEIIDKATEYVSDGAWLSGIFGGVVGVGLKIVSTVLNVFIVAVLMLYFVAGLDATKDALYRLAPASRRKRVAELSDEVIRGIGGYVSGAFMVGLCAGVSSLVFLFIVGMGEYAVALSFVVGLLSVIPMVGATISAVLVSAIAFATDPVIGAACLVFYIIYQQVENYVIYPRIMSRAVDVPGSVTVIAALIGAGLLGIIGALMAIPTAAAILLLTRELVIKKQDVR